MKLIALVIEKYNDLFENQVLNFSDEYKVHFDFETKELKITENDCYIDDFYGQRIYNITPIVGINGTGKTTILKKLGSYTQDEIGELGLHETFMLIFLNEKKQCFCYTNSRKVPKNIKYVQDESEKIIECKIISEFDDINIPNIIFLKNQDLTTMSFATRFGLIRYSDDTRPLGRFLPKLVDAYKMLRNFNGRQLIESKLFFEIHINEKYIPNHKGYVKYNVFKELSNNLKTIVDESLLFSMNKLLEDENIYLFEDKLKIVVKVTEQDDDTINKILDFSQHLEKYDEQNKEYAIFSSFPRYFMSTGEQNLLRLVSTILYENDFSEDTENIIFLIDEIESGLHLEWSRKLISNLIQIISKIGQKESYQLIFTTHSPYMLSDIKPGNVIMLEKGDDNQSKVKVLENTFAKNIQEIMKENLIDNIYGDFALEKINSMITRLNGEVKQGEDEEEKLLKEINLISEPILRNKLLDMYDKKYNTMESNIDKQLNQLNLNAQQRTQVKKMIEENNKKTKLG